MDDEMTGEALELPQEILEMRPRQVAKAYAAGEISREVMLEALVRYPYSPEPQFDPIDGMPLETPPTSTWDEGVGNAKWRGDITRDDYIEILDRRRERILAGTLKKIRPDQ